jgi:hypothetical protein
MAESKSDQFACKIKAHSEKNRKFASLPINRFAADSERSTHPTPVRGRNIQIDSRAGALDDGEARQRTAKASPDFAGFFSDRKNNRKIPYRFEACGYVPCRNSDATPAVEKKRDHWRTALFKSSQA